MNSTDQLIEELREEGYLDHANRELELHQRTQVQGLSGILHYISGFEGEGELSTDAICIRNHIARSLRSHVDISRKISAESVTA